MKGSLYHIAGREKASEMFKFLLNRVDLDPGTLGVFVSILEKADSKYKILVDKLAPGE